jgi:hypothetical protein
MARAPLVGALCAMSWDIFDARSMEIAVRRR